MDLCEHINNYSLALEYFPNCFDSHLKLKNDDKLQNKLFKRMERLRKDNDVEYEDLLLGAKYIEYLSSEKERFNDITNIELKSLYLRYEDLLSFGEKNGEGYNYLFLLSILKRPILETFNSMDSVYSFPMENTQKEIKLFVSKWNCLFSSGRKEYDYINLNIFLQELSDLTKHDPMLRRNDTVLEDALIQMQENPYVLKKKK